jgi:hypothetical protein
MGSLVPYPIPLINLELTTPDLLRLLLVELPDYSLLFLSTRSRTTVCLEEVRRNLRFSLTASLCAAAVGHGIFIFDLEDTPKVQ